ncbi:hypothetical protein [Paraflavitalea pollutisoli]|uniref:hypothetical protein n=1 Tax=Paraflavitalea pollutisoli TaxID=3034143 RepID=UPI0023ED3B5F|nr:hypothetical protein [Paraflavitalea sp. H1-2-19X]
MSRKLIQQVKRLFTRTSLWVISLLLVCTANAATAADAIFHQAIVLQWTGQQPVPLTETQEQAGPNNDLHYGERKAVAHRKVKVSLPWQFQVVPATPLSTFPPRDSLPDGASTRPAYYRFLFRYKPF